MPRQANPILDANVTAGARGEGHSTANDIGAGVAYTEPPSVPANKTEETETRQVVPVMELIWVADEVTGDFASEPSAGEGGEREIIARYRGMLESIRKLSRQMRALARCEARDWLRAGIARTSCHQPPRDRADRREKIRWRRLWKHQLSRPYLS
jgi:hypothetical protein